MMANKEASLVSFEQSGHVALVCNCHETGCMFCDGGLFACTRCGSFEGMTTTHCPGAKWDENVGDAIYGGWVDYRDGEWVPAGSPHTPHKAWQFQKEWFE